jgi:hypothetical protein
MATGTDGSGPQNAQPPTGATAQNLLAVSSGNVPSGYGSATATTTAGYGPGQAGAGHAPYPGTSGQSAAAASESVLTGAGYADATGPATRTLPTNIGGTTVSAPTMTTGTKATNPTSLVALVTNSIPTDVTVVSIEDAASNVVSTTVQSSGQYVVPPGGSITATFSGGTWTWAV